MKRKYKKKTQKNVENKETDNIIQTLHKLNLQENNEIFIENNSYKTTVKKENIIVKEIEKEYNFFFHAISIHLHKTEEYYPNYREIVYQLCLHSKDQLKKFFFLIKKMKKILIKI